MSEDTFERDLRLVLRDLAPADAPASLRAAVAAVPQTHPVPRRAARVANRQRFLAFGGIAAVIAVAALGLALALGGRFNGNVAGPSPIVGPSQSVPPPSATTGWVKLTYGSAISVADPSALPSAQPIDVASARLREARIPFSAVPTGTEFSVTVPSDRSAEAEKLIATTGNLDFVPLGNQPAEVGATIDLTAHPSLFGNGSVTSAAIGTDQTGQRTIDLALSPTARDLFATYTSAHIGEYFAIVIDGKVLTAPVIQSSIPNGQVQIQSGGVGGWDLSEASQLVTLLQAGAMPWPLTELSAEPAAAPAGLWTPGPSVAPTPTPAPSAAEIPAEGTSTELPIATGAPPTVSGTWSPTLTVAALATSAVPPRITAWAHGYLGLVGDNALFASVDGRSWTSWPIGFLGLDQSGVKVAATAACRDSVIAFIATGDGLVAARSSDGQTWQTHRVLPSPMAGGPFGYATGGSGGAVFVPSTGRSLYVTQDCTTWQAASIDLSDRAVITGVAAVGSGFVALGIGPFATTGDWSAAAWSSADGLTWTSVGVQNPIGVGFVGPPVVAPGQLIALAEKQGDTSGDLQIYESTDGTDWKPMREAIGMFATQGADGEAISTVKFTSDGQRILAYGVPSQPNAGQAFAFWLTSGAKSWEKLAFSGPAGATVSDPTSAADYMPVLSRDGILLFGPNSEVLFAQAVAQ